MAMNSAEYVADLVAKGHAAQKIAEGFTQEKVDQLTAAVAYALTIPDVALKFGEMLVEESGMGIPADKQAKMFGKVKGTYFQMKGQKSVGLVEVDEKMGMEKYAKPMGVIGAIIPVTNGKLLLSLNHLWLSRLETPLSLLPIQKQEIQTGKLLN
jgi:acyl-CoA reductase-like NAD-dependent aldehyde dehydrogenase